MFFFKGRRNCLLDILNFLQEKYQHKNMSAKISNEYFVCRYNAVETMFKDTSGQFGVIFSLELPYQSVPLVKYSLCKASVFSISTLKVSESHAINAPFGLPKMSVTTKDLMLTQHKYVLGYNPTLRIPMWVNYRYDIQYNSSSFKIQ